MRRLNIKISGQVLKLYGHEAYFMINREKYDINSWITGQLNNKNANFIN